MNISSIKPAHLSTSCGKLLCIQSRLRPNRSHQLVAKNEQKFNPGNSVKVYHILYNRTRQCMAFGFEVENKSVFPFVTNGEEVKFKALLTDKLITGKAFDETFLFKWGEQEISGGWRSLESVAKPKKYLCVKNEVKVIITEKQSPVFQICYSDEKKGEIQDNERNPYKEISWRRRNLKRGPSCRTESESNKPLCCNNRKTKRMKM
ncbi:uncharacterized protein [Sinocyclocheilus grahami]|uniref:uncharacterized protein isoform X1 n=1 Tax=Sinocyclocheilus grahami TaxID=75366 RepID=UPI0007AD2374|nr:PREDICTED: uncharacterized protein LOC107574710 isoform X1 [Sinocyclocheilus grahami]XP_016116641.1 PREDICTED: uncharacterized protein LOC107574710 isoform X1 [Sinocyclocheilus grahami]